MHRTTIMLPDHLKRAAQAHASERGISLGELVREALKRRLDEDLADRDRDPLFLDHDVFSDDGPGDVSERHDQYLYRDSSA